MEKSNIPEYVHTLIVFMIVLTFTTPLATLAEQNPVLEAKSDAARDARKDTNEVIWFCINAGGLPVAMMGGYTAGYYLLNPLLENSICSGVGGATCGLISCSSYFAILGLLTPQITIPPNKLIGKSPEYVETYVKIYKRKVGMRRVIPTGVGCLVGYGIAVALGTWLEGQGIIE